MTNQDLVILDELLDPGHLHQWETLRPARTRLIDGLEEQIVELKRLETGRPARYQAVARRRRFHLEHRLKQLNGTIQHVR